MNELCERRSSEKENEPMPKMGYTVNLEEIK